MHRNWAMILATISAGTALAVAGRVLWPASKLPHVHSDSSIITRLETNERKGEGDQPAEKLLGEHLWAQYRMAQRNRDSSKPALSSARWAPIAPYGILLDNNDEYFNAGRVTGVIATGIKGYLVSTSNSGLFWLVGPGKFELPLSEDWQHPDVNSICQGRDNSQFFAAGSGLYVNVYDPQLPLLKWHEISLGPLGSNIFIYKVLYDKARDYLVIATNKGVFFARMQSDGMDILGGWRVGKGLVGEQCWSMAFSRSRYDGEGLPLIVGTYRSDKDKFSPIYYGRYTTVNGVPSLSFTPAKFPKGLSANMYCTSVTTQSQDAIYGYALSSDDSSGRTPYSGHMACILKTTDGGQTWIETGYSVQGVPQNINDLRTQDPVFLGDQGYGFNNTIAMANGNPNILAVGMVHPFISNDGGNSWKSLAYTFNTQANFFVGDNPAVHDDYHFIGFVGLGSQPDSIFLGNDGGMLESKYGKTFSFESRYNLKTDTLLCGQYQGFGVSEQVAGLAVCGTQDNGDCYAVAGRNVPYGELDQGYDGSQCRFIKTGQMIYDSGNVLAYATWDGIHLNRIGAIPVTSDRNHNYHEAGLKFTAFEPVRTLGYKWNGGTVFAYAIASVPDELDPTITQNRDVYVLTGDNKGNGLHLDYLTRIDVGPSESIWGIGVNDPSHGIYLGSSTGRAWFMEPSVGLHVSLETKLPVGQDGNDLKGNMPIIRVNPDGTSAYAVFDTGTAGYILNLTNQTFEFDLVGDHVGNEGPILGLELGYSPTGGPIKDLYASTDRTVYRSTNLALSWNEFSTGLPAWDHGGGLVYVQSGGVPFLYVSTYGRGIYRTMLGP